MSDDICLLCKNVISTFKYNIDEDYTKYSNLLLRTILEGVFEHKVVLTSHLNVCVTCLDLLNELDFAESTYKKVRQKVVGYLGHISNQTNKCNVYCQTDVFIEPDVQSNKVVINKLDDSLDVGDTIKKEKFKLEETKECSVAIQDNKEQNNLNLTDVVDYEQDVNNDDYQNNPKTKSKGNRGRKKKYPDVLKPYKCMSCPKTWKTLGELKSHLSAHSDARPYICEVCGQAYKHKSALDVHIGMHNGIYPFMCKYCKKSFTQKGALHRHLPIHTGETPYQCDLCGKRFVHHTSFNIHQLSHSGQKDYKCAQCGLGLLSGSHLKRHMRVHTGERNYVCAFCGKRFAERYNLVSHQKLHENPSTNAAFKRNHRCQTCGITFNRRLKLDEHLAKEHQKVSDIDIKSNIPVLHMFPKVDTETEWTANCSLKNDIPETSY